ncbi:tyrosine kinase receptor Cad96Ca-like [Amphiura filiformis]|uniref:tyrosine kinase receptor Cad96Ca-like n=1 Tax=Amphiura filiformis TaxID=82378 RepID=UPI003B22329F
MDIPNILRLLVCLLLLALFSESQEIHTTTSGRLMVTSSLPSTLQSTTNSSSRNKTATASTVQTSVTQTGTPFAETTIYTTQSTTVPSRERGGLSGGLKALVAVLILVVVIALVIVAIIFVKRWHGQYYPSGMYQVGISPLCEDIRNSVVTELDDRNTSNDRVTNSNDNIPSRHSGMVKSEQVQKTYDDSTTYANVTASLAFPRSKLEIMRELGHGEFGKVLLAKAKGIMGINGETDVAVKTLKEDASSSDREELLQEVDLMKILEPHPNVVRLLGYCTEKDPIYVVVEYMGNGDLKTFLRQSRSTKKDNIYDNLHSISASLSLMQLITFARQTATGMEYLSSQKCIHRDLAARNVLVNDELVCKVSDFGLARDVINVRVYQRQREELRLPIRWMALESLVESAFTTESDVWSFGILLWEIITLGARPYPGTDTKDVVSGLKLGMRMPCPTHCPLEIYTIMESCWKADPSERPSFTSIVNMLHDLLEMESMHAAMQAPEESLYEATEKALDNEKL